jgi:hypothetical protein
LSFVETNGLPITGRITQAQVLYKALKRTGIDKNLTSSISIFYTGLADTESVLDNVYVISQRYIKDDGETFMSCEEVIRDILEPYGAILTSLGDKWYIYKPNELYASDFLNFSTHDLDGNLLTQVPIDFAKELGSKIESYYPHHASQNQSITVKPSVGAYRISYKYGLVKSVFENQYLCSADGVTINDWTIIDNTFVNPLTAGECGASFSTDILSGSFIEQLRSDAITVPILSAFRLKIKYNILRQAGFFTSVNFTYRVMVSDKVITDGTGLKYYLQDIEKKKFKGVNPELIKKMAQLQSESEKLYVFKAKKEELEVGSILISKQFKNLIYLI